MAEAEHYNDEREDPLLNINNATVLNYSCANATRLYELPLHPHWLYKVIVEVGIASTLCLFGFLGNSLTIVVLHRDKDKHNTTNWLLQTLAIVDSFYLAACIFIQPIKTMHEYTDWIPTGKQFFPYVEPYMWPIASIAQTATVWMILLITIDRYIAVCMPLKKQWRNLVRAKLSVLILLLAACLYNIPRFFEQVLVYKTDCQGFLFIRAKLTEFRLNRLYFLIYHTISYFVLRSIGPLTILVILNVHLVRALRVLRKRKKEMKENLKHHESLTAMFVVVVLVFVVCELPDLGLRIAVMLYKFGWIRLDIMMLRYVNTITNTLLAVNSSTNFIIYCLVGKSSDEYSRR